MLTSGHALQVWRRRAWLRRQRPDDETGIVLVFTAISLVVLLALAGFAVDFSHWSREEARLQKAADAAALAGAVYMPDNTGNVAYTTAQAIAGRNGFTNGQNGVTVTTSVVERGQGACRRGVRGGSTCQRRSTTGRSASTDRSTRATGVSSASRRAGRRPRRGERPRPA
ncbi:MAG TPA: pilus assembly protein TadG-related protein [Acidimicrobiia bacterium]